ncbi:hypothetical protein FPQ18DRAFT_335492 [Pyronema domesticum]|nr:hypothetical protein FPQ18DRAFT_335492 [Pyronema domesticum]
MVVVVLHCWLVGFLAPSTMLIVRGVIMQCHHPFLFALGCLHLLSCGFAHCNSPFLCSFRGSSGHIGYRHIRLSNCHRHGVGGFSWHFGRQARGGTEHGHVKYLLGSGCHVA